MNFSRPAARLHRAKLIVVSLLCALLVPVAFGQGKKKNPASKVYVADVSGDATVETNDNIEDLAKRSVYNAEGMVIETKHPEKAEDREKSYSTMVYSNGTGAFFDTDTRVEVKQFVQEPFTPTRSDVDVEPSISNTSAFVAHGAVGLCTSKQVAGSSMNYQTPHASVNIHGQKVVIETNQDGTTISMLEGDSTVRAGAGDLGGHTVHAGEQAVIRPGAAGQPNSIQISPIPPSAMAPLDDKVAMACMAKKTVYFEVKQQLSNNQQQALASTAEASPGGKSDTPNGDSNGRVSAFDGTTGGGIGSNAEIVAVPIVPANLPVQFTISPASLTTPGRGGGG